MSLWLSCCLLLASVFLSSSAPTPEECQPLVAPVSLANSSLVNGKMNFLAGYTDNNIFKAILKETDGSWFNSTRSPSNPTEFIMYQYNKMNGTCIRSKASMTKEGDTVKTSVPNVVSVSHVLPGCDGCIVLSINTTVTNIEPWLKLLNLDDEPEAGEIRARSLYIFGKAETLKDYELEQFRKQASCLGFSGELDYLYNPEKGFCQEDEGILLPF